ncbi:MAG TPA: hypothetical protein DHV60_02115 [Verrucomicrobiales bacterium]|nr:hypothetical protein [Verrucomicrobiales bacterium]
MRDLSNKVTVSDSNHDRYKYRVRYPEGGKRKNKYFNNKDEANKFAAKTRKDIAKDGIKAAPITDPERRAVDTFREFACELPKKTRPTLAEVVDYYIQHTNLRDSSLTCQEVADKLLLRIQKEGRGKRHQDDVTSRLDRFNEDYGDWLTCDVSTEIIDEFLDDMDVANQTKLNYRNKVNQLFTHAVKLGACESNPVEHAIKPKTVESEIGVLTPHQTAVLLGAANDAVLPGLAIGFFAGLRESEIQRLNWSDIDLDEGHILVKAKNAKSAQRRIVNVSDNLHEWLLPHAKESGRVIGEVPWQWRCGKEFAREAAGLIPWPSNAARHSFASYHLAEHKDAGKTSLELGHSNQRIIFQHYRQLVRPKVAETYWSITPDEAENIINMKGEKAS